MNQSFIPFLFFILISGISCSDSEKKRQLSIDDLSQVYPAEIISFTSIDSVYFSHLGYTSIATHKEHFVISDRQLPTILLIDQNASIINSVREGRGPGEIIDAYRFNQDKEGNIYTYDQMNRKIVSYDTSLNLIEETIPKSFEGSGIVAVYPFSNNKFVFELTSFSFMQDKEKDREKIFVKYDAEKEEYGDKLVLKDRPYALDFIEDRIVGAGAVPFSFIQLTSHDPISETLFSYDTRTSIIAEIDFNFDTLQAIPVNLPTELLSDMELDSIRKAVSRDKRIDRWKTIKPLLPEYKSAAENMIVHEDNIWLQSNLRGNSQRWFVLNKKGQILKVVHFPKDGMVTHISDKNIGIRLDDSTFGLYTNPKLEIQN